MRELSNRKVRRSLLIIGFVIVVGVVAATVIASLDPLPRGPKLRGFYVSMAGSDHNDGSSTKPWRTIQKAVDAADPGSVIYIGGGTFEPFVADRPHLTITASSGDTVIIRGRENVQDIARLAADDITLSGVTVEGCIPRLNQGANTADDTTGVRIDQGTHGVRVSNVTVRDSHGVNSEGRPIGCYGILVRDAINAVVDGNDLYHNGFGVAVLAGKNTRVANNRIHDNDVLIHNTKEELDDDFGAVGIQFVTVSDGATAEGNVLYRNQTESSDYVTEGGAFDIYQSSNIIIRRNLMINNEIMLETGTAADGDCLNNTFAENIAFGKSSDNKNGRAFGILLRCANHMAVVNNILSTADEWIFLITAGGKFDGSVTGLKIEGNSVWQESGPTYKLDIAATNLAVDINRNSYHATKPFAKGWTGEPVATLAEWQQLTGFDRSSNCDCQA
jgi:parallel beta-helix repeat protein